MAVQNELFTLVPCACCCPCNQCGYLSGGYFDTVEITFSNVPLTYTDPNNGVPITYTLYQSLNGTYTLPWVTRCQWFLVIEQYRFSLAFRYDTNRQLWLVDIIIEYSTNFGVLSTFFLESIITISSCTGGFSGSTVFFEASSVAWGGSVSGTFTGTWMPCSKNADGSAITPTQALSGFSSGFSNGFGA